LNGWVDAAADYRVREKSGNLFLLPSGLEHRVMELDKQLNLRKSGVKAGTLIRDELVPDHELALSRYLSGDSPFIELDLSNALKYLRKQEILPQVPGRGWFVVRHQGLALGLVKHLGNRVNNYYPASWRILMS
jgi:NOL1/NOP2/fmu family ribosome biogenesis protein